ncbi:MAG: AtpZ/AtpI family protein [Oscillospiraceae bacterium]|nr:AtpZ/AtpI family protein [Oscillospiraceae bacterium]MBQ6160309.1 AtpZ/AtpI family protein [Oscillospiraceae bacterium]
MRGYVKIVSYLVWLSQLGLSVAVPLAGFILLGVWLHNSKGWGGWTVVAGIVLGLMGAAGGLYNSLKTLNRLSRQDETPPKKGYNEHE